MTTLLLCQKAMQSHSSAGVGEAGPDLFKVVFKAGTLNKRIFSRSLTTISKCSGTGVSQCILKALRCAHRPRVEPGSANHQQYKTGFSFLLCQESCPSIPDLLLRIPDPGTVKHASQLPKPTERRSTSGRISLCCLPKRGSRPILHHQPPLLGTRSPLYPTA